LPAESGYSDEVTGARRRHGAKTVKLLGQNRHHPRPPFAGTWEDEMQILIVAICTLAAIWVVVLWGSRYIGPR